MGQTLPTSIFFDWRDNCPTKLTNVLVKILCFVGLIGYTGYCSFLFFILNRICDD